MWDLLHWLWHTVSGLSFPVQMSFVLHQAVLEGKISSPWNYSFYVSVNKGTGKEKQELLFSSAKKGKWKYDFRWKYHMSNSSGGKLSFHSQVVPINPTPKCYRCTTRRMTHRSSIYTDEICNSTLHSSLLICLLPCCTILLLHILYLEQEVDDFGEFRNITEATD